MTSVKDSANQAVGLSPSQQALLEKRLQERLQSRGKISTIPRIVNRTSLPLSFAQQRLWFLHQLEPDSSVYNRPVALRLNGSLNPSVLARTLNEIVRRHEILRASFPTMAGQPALVIAPELSLNLRAVDLQELPAAEREAEAIRLATEEARRPFDLAREPLMRSHLFQLGPNDSLLLLVMHHIVFDAWSARVLIHEMASLYEAFAAGRASPLPEPTIQYADFACWQQQWMRDRVLEGQISFWKQQLAGSPPRLTLPTDHPRPSIQTLRGAVSSLTFSQSFTKSLKDFSRQEGVTLFMLLLATFQTQLHRYSGENDIRVGSPVAGRNRVETEDLVGLFINTLVLRGDFSDNPSFRELLSRIRKMCLESYAHQDLPFEKLVREMQPERDLSRTPLFQVMFNLENIPEKAIETSSLRIQAFELDIGTAPFDLTLEILESDHSLHCQFVYNTDLFDASAIERLMAHFQILLEGILANPEQQIGLLPLLTQTERQQILVEWNKTEVDYPKTACVHELFEKQVELTPDSTAVVFEDQRLTYRELNQQANQLAHYLRNHGVGPDVLVGICMERSLEMVVAILGILKAGGAYLPLDPDYPKGRLEFMIADAQAGFLITQGRLSHLLTGSVSRLLSLDTHRTALALEQEVNPPRYAAAEDLAYVIYTSGTTGRPKGVMISHRSLCNHIAWEQRVHPISPSDAVLQNSTFSFDASVWEFFAPLLAGARLILVPSWAHLELGSLIKIAIENNVTVLQAVPSLLAHLIDEPNLVRLKTLKHMISGGEVLSSDLAKRILARLPSIALHNTYGPTEATIWALCWTCDANHILPTIPIGRPIDNVQAYVVDARMQPVPVGVPGELLLGGDSLARGYLNRPDITAEKFVAHPFSEKAGARLYRTGDLVRWLADGKLEFLGRTDDQVKIRGYRIELGEIESVLARHPQVKQAAVLAREDIRGEKHLVAYTVPACGQPPSFKDLRGYLKQSLPNYMVPSAFVLLEKLPLTPSGKVDRRALPAPKMDRLEAPLSYEAPQSPVEELVVKIWAEVLGVEHVGLRDNFFDLGGHSLLAIRMMARVRRTLEVDLPLRSLFESPTVEGIALAIVQCMSMKEKTEIADLLGEAWEESRWKA